MIKTQQDYDAFCLAVKNYSKFVAGKERQYIKQFSSFVGTKNKQTWRDYLESDVVAAVKPKKIEVENYDLGKKEL
jgi:hypothetical protein